MWFGEQNSFLRGIKRFFERLQSALSDVFSGASTTARSVGQQIKVYAWAGVGDEAFCFPELRAQDGEHSQGWLPHLHAKPNVGVCLSGGGNRAATLALGWVRGLRSLDFLRDVRYLSSNSGGSWFNTAFSFQQVVPTADFLGEPVVPAQLTPERASEAAGIGIADAKSFDSVVAAADGFKLAYVKSVVAQAFTPVKEVVRGWSVAVGETYLERHALSDVNSSFALHGAHSAKALRTLETHATKVVHTACREPCMPFPIVTCCIACPNDNTDSTSLFLPMEWTPLYVGVPTAPSVCPPSVPLGGVFIEPIGACSGPPNAVSNAWAQAHKPSAIKARAGGANDHEAVAEEREEGLLAYQPTVAATHVEEVAVALMRVTPLVEVAGMSSAFGAMGSNSTRACLWQKAGNPSLSLWGYALQGGDFGCCDAARYDNLAIYPQLRRGVRALLICFASAETPEDTETFATNAPYFAAYFGCVPEESAFESPNGALKGDGWNKFCKVFEQEGYVAVVSQLIESAASGKAAYARARLRVVPNKFQGVNHAYEVDTLWLLNEGRAEWSAELPAGSKKLVASYTEVDNFPHTGNLQAKSKGKHRPELMSAYLSNLATWNVVQIEKQIQSLVEEARGV